MSSWQWIDPLSDQRWPSFVDRHQRASVFHTRGWLKALNRAYGFEPVALATAAPDGPLASAVVFCRVRSWLTGRRLVSLPFSDHCDPLTDEGPEQEGLMDALRSERERGRWKYVELRSTHGFPVSWAGLFESERYYLHRLDLRGDSNDLFAKFHKNHVVRKIRRSEREKLRYEEGRSDALLQTFYKLLVQTRRRHTLPPQPIGWFRAVLDCLPEQARVRVAFKDDTPVASIVTLRQRDIMMYKYGASDAALHALGGMPFLFWRTICDAREQGCVTLDLGRSEIANEGLVAFKEHSGATHCHLSYLRDPPVSRRGAATEQLGAGLAQRVFSIIPDRLLIAAGRTLYPHIG